jgi:hypothetical protein
MDLEVNPEEIEATVETIEALEDWLGNGDGPWYTRTHTKNEPGTILQEEPLQNQESRREDARTLNTIMK